MEKYERNIKIKRVLTTLDTNNDGVDDTIAYLNQEDLYLPFLLKQSVKDLGVYTDYEEEDDIIDLGSFWDTNNDGFGDGGINPISSGSTSPYGDGVDSPSTAVNGSNIIIFGCTDPTDPNYNPSATVDDGSCLSSQDFDTNVSVGNNSSSGTGGSSGGAGGCYRLSSGASALDWNSYESTAINLSNDWCDGTATSCNGNPYATTANCTPNGCSSNTTTCCPGPSGTYSLLTQTKCNNLGIDCSGNSGCNCNNPSAPIFPLVHLVSSTYDNNNDKWTHVWEFYCFPV